MVNCNELDHIQDKLHLSDDEFDALITGKPAGGYDGARVAARIRQQFGLAATEPLRDGLLQRGILTEYEVQWFEDTAQQREWF